MQELNLVVVQAHVATVRALGFRDLVQRQARNHDIGVLCQVDGRVTLGGILAAVTEEALLVPNKGEAALPH